jgi:hypothetical protein
MGGFATEMAAYFDYPLLSVFLAYISLKIDAASAVQDAPIGD